MVNMTSVVSECLYHTIPVLVFVDGKVNLKNSCTKSKEDKAVELTTSNAIVILGSSFVDLWLYLF
jgi:hypothetical protein